MSVSDRVKHFLNENDIAYGTVPHPKSETASASAHAAHVTGEQVAKSVVVHHELGYVLAVVPSTFRVELDTLQNALGKRLGLASEDEVSKLFDDCDKGAIPPLGRLYGLDVIVEEDLLTQPDIYFEGGDHKTLVHVSGENFQKLFEGAQRAHIGHHA